MTWEAMGIIDPNEFLSGIRRCLNPFCEANSPLGGQNDAAVAILFRLIEGIPCVLFTRRSEGLRSHSGQVSFPGGNWESGDSSLLQTALRETEEEVGIKRVQIQILGSLDVEYTHREKPVYPFVGFISVVKDLRINPDEVDHVFWVPFPWLLESGNCLTRPYTRTDGNTDTEIFYLPWEGEVIWGFSAQILDQLKRRVNSQKRTGL